MSYPGAKLGARQRQVAHDLDSVWGGTLTSVGFIPHLNYRGLRCPVMLEVVRLSSGNQLYTNGRGNPYPMRTRGGYLFALPGGQSVEGPRRSR